MRDLDWKPKYSLLEGLKDSYENDFKLKKVNDSRYSFPLHFALNVPC